MASAHPALNFRRSFAAPTPNKASPAISQHTSPYQHQAYPAPHGQQAPFQQHLFPSPASTPVPVPNVQNGTRQMPPQVAQRGPPRQMQPQTQQGSPMNYLTQELSQPPLAHSIRANDNPMLSQLPPQHQQSQPTLPPQPPPPSHIQHLHHVPQAPPASQVPQQMPNVRPNQHSVHQVQQMPPLPQLQAQNAPRAETQGNRREARQEDSMELDSSTDDIDASTSATEVKGPDGVPFVPREAMGHPMSPPPQGGSFPTLEAVHKFVLEYCTSVGYAVVIGRSKKTNPGLKKVLFVCDRAGKPPKRVSPEMRKRKTSSRKCDCQFGFFAIEQRTQWTIRYRPDSQHLQHNHGPSESPAHHPAARKLDSQMVAAVKSLKESGIGVTQTLEILQEQNPHVPLLPRDIYNARAAISRNPAKIATGLAENRPAIYSKPHPTAEERIRADLRRELAKAREEIEKVKADSQKEIEGLKNQLKAKDDEIKTFNKFIDLCNARAMAQRETLFNEDGAAQGTAPAAS